MQVAERTPAFERAVTRSMPGPRRIPGTLALFAGTILLAAALLFALEPMFAKMTLPLLGGSSAVWVTSIVFYQVLFVGAYLYAHVLRSRGSVRVQICIHALLVLGALAALPIHPEMGALSNVARSPLQALGAMLLRGVGAPFFVLATTSPLLQAWFSRTNDEHARNPYFLYAASNAGSMASVLLYPFAIEPLFGLHVQSGLWTLGYIAFALGLFGCAAMYWFSTEGTAPTPAARRDRALGPEVTARRRARWIILAAVPSSLMLGNTTHLSTMVAPIPLLWALPLALYLATFIVVFSAGVAKLRFALRRAVPYAVLPVVVLLALQSSVPVGWYVAAHCSAFFLLALACHGEIADDRPSPEGLTDFYLMIAIGGAAGGLFNALVAPFLFPHVGEYPLALIAACALIPAAAGKMNRRDLVWPAALGLALAGALGLSRGATETTALVRILFGAAMVACFSFSSRPVRFALGLGAVLLAATALPSSWGHEVAVERNFFGVKRVITSPSGRFRLFAHGATIHGVQWTDVNRAQEPLAYYTRSGPLGQIYGVAVARDPFVRVGVLGLGIGTIACYHRPGQRFTLYEIDPAVERMAETTFTYLAKCAPQARILTGDARLSLAAGSPLQAGLLVLDAYSADQLPLHLITREALQVYLRNIRRGGLLAFNISSNYFDLSPVLANLAGDARLVAYVRDDRSVTPARARAGAFGSVWVVMARRATDLGTLPRDRRWRAVVPAPRLPLWTDDYSSLMRLVVYRYTS